MLASDAVTFASVLPITLQGLIAEKIAVRLPEDLQSESQLITMKKTNIRQLGGVCAVLIGHL